MNSALKPVLPTPGAQPGGQASPAKANVANANHAVGHPQGAQNSLHHGTNNLVGQNLTHHAPAPPPPAHPVPSMAPVTPNMAQMAQNMSHHGNLSHVTQNSVAPTNMAASPNKSATTSAPLSLVADKPVPLALTRTPEKKDESPGPANGTVESPKSASNAPVGLKPQNSEPNKEKQDIAKTSPSTPKPPEKPTTASTSAPATPQKVEPAVPVSTVDGPSQPKVATANEAPEKSPSKPAEPKLAPTADVAPTQSDSKPVPESAKDSQVQQNQEKAAIPATSQKPEATQKPETPSVPKTETPAKPEEKKEEPKPERPAQNNTEEKEPKPEIKDDKPDKKEEKPEKKEEAKTEATKPEAPVVKEAQEAPKLEEAKPEENKSESEKKPETKPDPKSTPRAKAAPKPTMKLATVTPPVRKRRHTSPKPDGPTPAKKAATEGEPSTPDSRKKRNRTQVQLYQSPTPELTMATKLSASAGRQTPTKPGDDKLIVFYKNEYLAVRNAEGSFYVCQTMQNVYRTSRKIKIRWLSQDKSDPTGETYKPDFYDVTDMECVLTTLSLSRAPAGGGAQLLKPAEEARAKSILERALKAEQSGAKNIELTEEHPDGLDLSLYKDESQLEKKGGRKRAATSATTSPRSKEAAARSAEPQKDATPMKKARTTPKRSPPSASARKPAPAKTPPKPHPLTKRIPAGSTPTVAPASKTATAVTEKAKGKSTPKRTPAKAKPEEKVVTPAPAARSAPTTPAKPATPATPARQGRRSAAKAEAKPVAAAPVPSTSTGKTTRTPRKPPAKK